MSLWDAISKHKEEERWLVPHASANLGFSAYDMQRHCASLRARRDLVRISAGQHALFLGSPAPFTSTSTCTLGCETPTQCNRSSTPCGKQGSHCTVSSHIAAERELHRRRNGANHANDRPLQAEHSLAEHSHLLARHVDADAAEPQLLESGACLPDNASR